MAACVREPRTHLRGKALPTWQLCRTSIKLTCLMTSASWNSVFPTRARKAFRRLVEPNHDDFPPHSACMYHTRVTWVLVAGLSRRILCVIRGLGQADFCFAHSCSGGDRVDGPLDIEANGHSHVSRRTSCQRTKPLEGSIMLLEVLN